MSWHDDIRQRLADSPLPPDEGVVEELAQHAAEAYDAAKAQGLSDEAARTRVLDVADAWCREPRVRRRRAAAERPPPPSSATSGWSGAWLDVVYGARLLARQPSAAVLTILTIALAVGATTTLASVAYGVLARPLPWPDADRVVRVVESRAGGSQGRRFLTNVGYHSWLDHSTTLEALAGYSSPTVTVDTGTGPDRVQGAVVTASLFDVLRTQPLRGRLFNTDDEESNNVVLVSRSFWQRNLASSDSLGQTITIEGGRHTVVGILPDDFAFPEPETMVWTPFRIDPLALEDGGHLRLEMFSGIGRLKPGVAASAATDEATTALRNGPQVGMVGVAVFGSDGPATLTATPIADMVTSEVRPALLLLLAGVSLLYLTAVGGIATMQVARAVSRRREIALRSALGAGSRRIARQLWVEHLVVGLIGGAAGLALAVGAHAALPSLLPADFPRQEDIVLDWRIGAVAGLLAVAASLMTAVFPMLHARRINLTAALAEGGRTSLGARLRTPATRIRAAAIAGQVAVTVVLLVGALLLGRSFMALIDVDRGYDPHNLLTARLPIAEGTMTADARTRLLEDIASRLASLPTVRRVGYGGAAPFMPGGSMLGLQIAPDAAGTAEPRSAKADLLLASPGYIDALGMRVVEGRAFTDDDSATSEPVLMVNESFAREYLPNGALDVTLPLGFVGGGNQWRIVGVVADVAPADVETPASPVILASSRQFTGEFGITDAKFVVRTTGDPVDVVPAMREIVRGLAPQAPLDSVETMADRLSSSLSRPRLYALLLTVFSGFALLIAAVGLFAVLSHGVAERRRELGVRLALGATPRSLIGSVMSEGLRLALFGTATGLGAAWMLARTVDTLLFGVSAHDPLSYTLVGAAVALVAVGACGGPALRAARVNPIEVLRGE